MNKNEKNVLMNIIKEDGVKGAVSALVYSLHLYANEVSDMGLKEKAREAVDAAELLRKVKDSITE